ncbi:hypothetical protein D3C76_1327730 [compost metagenome]
MLSHSVDIWYVNRRLRSLIPDEVNEMSDQFSPENMPVLSLNTASTTRYEASSFLGNAKAMGAYLAESIKANDAEGLIHTLAEAAKAKDVNKSPRNRG